MAGRLAVEVGTLLRGAATTCAPGKIAFFSAHDTTLIALLDAIGAGCDEWPG